MRPDHLVALGCLAVLAGCPGKSANPDGGTTVNLDDGGTFARSSKGQLRFKGPDRLAADFAAALDLAPAELCNELGQYACTSVVHPLALGGVDPYGAGLYEPPPVTGATAPIVVERVALAGCATRVARDAANPASAVIFRDVALAGGKLADAASPTVRASLITLYQRALLREPSDAEVAALLALAHDLEQGPSPTPAVDWMKASCFITLTSAEAVFY